MVDLDVATTFPNREAMNREDEDCSSYEDLLAEELGGFLVRSSGLPLALC